MANRDEYHAPAGLRGIPDDEPVFIIRAQDAVAVDAIRNWVALARHAGAGDRKLLLAEDMAQMFAEWQEVHPDRVKVPDADDDVEGTGDAGDPE